MGDFYAINLFGMIITYEKLSKEELNHERIHSAQQKELLYIPFYIWYSLIPQHYSLTLFISA